MIIYKRGRGFELGTSDSLRSRRLEVVGTRKNGRAKRRHACLPHARPFSLSPTTSKRLLRRLDFREQIQLSVGARLELACAWKHLRLEIEPRTITAQEINKELVLCTSLNSETAKSKSPNGAKVATSTFHDATTGESPTK